MCIHFISVFPGVFWCYKNMFERSRRGRYLSSSKYQRLAERDDKNIAFSLKWKMERLKEHCLLQPISFFKYKIMRLFIRLYRVHGKSTTLARSEERPKDLEWDSEKQLLMFWLWIKAVKTPIKVWLQERRSEMAVSRWPTVKTKQGVFRAVWGKSNV